MPSADRTLRRTLPFVLIGLAVLAAGLSGTPWLRAYPASTLAVPMVGAAALAVLVPVVAVGIGLSRLWLTAIVDVIVYVFFTLFVGLHSPLGIVALWDGLVHGPSQILTFALPLVSPRTLLVAPLTLCWIAGAVFGECLARSWHSVVPYATGLTAFGLAYAGSVRGVSSLADGRRYDVLLAAALLLVLLVMRAVEAWIEQDLDAEVEQPDGRLPVRGLVTGLVVALVVTVLASLVSQAGAFGGPPVTPDRRPPIEHGTPLSPVAFVAGLRPRDTSDPGSPVFSIRVNRATTNYVGIADVDVYDGEGWTFDRTFRPSGGEIPGESDPTLRAGGPAVTQDYTIDRGALTDAPWMPFLYRPRSVAGTSIDVDSSSGMIVPSTSLHAGQRYSVTSDVATRSFDALPTSSYAATSTPPTYTFVPGDVSASLGDVISTFEDETNPTDSNPIAFLQALSLDLAKNYALSGAAPAASSSSSETATPAASPTATRAAVAAGGTGFATVLASILGPQRSATPEQYATLVALVARQLGVPSKLVAGFRVGDRPLEPGHTYRATTAEAWTWVEIPVTGQGWVVLDPSPARGTVATPSTSPAGRATPTPTPTRTPNGLATASDRGHAVAPKSTVPGTSSAHPLPVLLIVIAALVLGLLLAAGLLWGRKWLRQRRRRRAGDPRRRLLGAWQEGLDVLVESGLPDPESLTSAEVADLTADQFGHEPAAQARFLGDRANVAIFSPTTWITASDADAAWHAQTVLRRSVRRRLTLRQRIGAQVRYRRSGRTRPLVGPASWGTSAAAGAAPTTRRARGRHSSRRRGH